jgi:hypothetical protein
MPLSERLPICVGNTSVDRGLQPYKNRPRHRSGRYALSVRTIDYLRNRLRAVPNAGANAASAIRAALSDHQILMPSWQSEELPRRVGFPKSCMSIF